MLLDLERYPSSFPNSIGVAAGAERPIHMALAQPFPKLDGNPDPILVNGPTQP